MGPDVAGDVARGQEHPGVEAAEGLGQSVADLLEPSGQAGVVEDEPDVVLDDPEPFAGAAGGGIQDAPDLDRLTGVGQLKRRDLGVERDRLGNAFLGLGQAVDEAVDVEPGLRQDVGRGGRCRRRLRGQEAGEQVLGADGAGPVEGAGEVRGVVEQGADLGRLRDGRIVVAPVAGRLLRLAERGEEPRRIEPELEEHRRGPALGLVDERRDQVGGLDRWRPAPAGAGLGTLDRPEGPGGEGYEHGGVSLSVDGAGEG